jgi:hypothetical protein
MAQNSSNCLFCTSSQSAPSQTLLPCQALINCRKAFKKLSFHQCKPPFYNGLPIMSTFTLHLGAPSHAVEPALLAQRLPTLAAALRGFVSAPATTAPTAPLASAVQVHAAQLGVQRDHVTLEALPKLDAFNHQTLAAITASLAGEFAAESLIYTAASHSANNGFLGILNLHAALPPAANFIGRDIAKALPRTNDARVLRQFVNAAQMTLHQSPALSTRSNGGVNSLWCCNALPTDDLSRTWLQGGLTAWWDALPTWDAALDINALNAASQLNWVYSDVTLSLALKRRATWALWAKPLALAATLTQAQP